jgi:hypothetical protein
MERSSERGMLAGLVAGIVLGLTVFAAAGGLSAVVISADSAAAAGTQPQAVRQADLYLAIVTCEMTGSKLGPAYVPADFTVPAHATVTVRIVDFDGATPQEPVKYARVWGTVGNQETVQPIRANDPNAPGQAYETSALNPNTAVGHTFTVPGLHLNILDSEHAVAFSVGVLAARSRWGVTPVSGRELSAAVPLR